MSRFDDFVECLEGEEGREAFVECLQEVTPGEQAELPAEAARRDLEGAPAKTVLTTR